MCHGMLVHSLASHLRKKHRTDGKTVKVTDLLTIRRRKRSLESGRVSQRLRFGCRGQLLVRCVAATRTSALWARARCASKSGCWQSASDFLRLTKSENEAALPVMRPFAEFALSGPCLVKP